ncbi:MAG: hypothetical protein AB1600_08105 [Bacteroidota bacterium]
MKQVFLLSVLLLLVVAGCSDNTTNMVTAPNNDKAGVNFSYEPKILSPSDNGPTVTVTASDTLLWPPNKKWKTVTFSGTLSDYTSATYTLTDEYGKISYTGTLSGTTYSVSLQLKAERKGKDKDGRTYTFTVTAVGSLTVSKSINVIVPHDKNKSGGKDHDDDDGDDEEGDD